MKISKSEIDKMIKEEFQIMLEKKKLKSQLSQINEELKKMESEDSLNEVEADGETKVASHAWTGEANGDTKFKPKFEKIGSHLKEDMEEEGFLGNVGQKVGQFMGTKWSPEQAQQAYNQTYAKTAQAAADKLGIDVPTYQQAATAFMQSIGGLMTTSNSKWDPTKKAFTRLAGNSTSTGNFSESEEVGGEEMPMDETPMGEFEAKFAEIGKAIDAKMSGGAGEDIGEEPKIGEEPAIEDDANDEDFEEVEVSPDEEEKEEGEDEEIEEEVSASQHLNPEASVKSTEEDSNLKGVVQEDLEEPIEGESVAQMIDGDKVNDNMEKDKHVKEGKKATGKVITEAAKPAVKNIFTEGLDAKRKANLLEEMKRMKKFAGLSRDED